MPMVQMFKSNVDSSDVGYSKYAFISTHVYVQCTLYVHVYKGVMIRRNRPLNRRNRKKHRRKFENISMYWNFLYSQTWG